MTSEMRWVRNGRRRERAGWLVLAIAAAWTAGCGGDDEEPAATADAAGEGSVGDGEANDALPGADQGVDGAAPEEAEAEAAAEAGRPRYGLFVGSDYNVQVKVAVVDLGAKAVQGTVLSVPAAFGDVSPYASGGRGFLMEGSDGKVLVLNETQPWLVARTIEVSDDADAEAGRVPVNPHAVVVSAATKAYVVRYGSNTVLVVDPATGERKGRIDLSSFVGPGDPDGLVEASDGVFDATTKRVYLLLQRIDQTNPGLAPDQVSQCLGFSPVIVAIDATTDQIIDLHGADGGSRGLPLLGQNPGALVSDLANGRLIVVETGCYVAPDGGVDADAGASYPRQLRGIEAVRLSDGASTWLYQHTQPDRLNGLVWADATHAFVNRKDSTYTNHWYAWNPMETTLGAEIPGFPEFGSYDEGRVFGLSTTFVDGGSKLSVVSFDVGSGQISTLVDDAFDDTTPYANGTAILK